MLDDLPVAQAQGAAVNQPGINSLVHRQTVEDLIRRLGRLRYRQVDLDPVARRQHHRFRNPFHRKKCCQKWVYIRFRQAEASAQILIRCLMVDADRSKSHSKGMSVSDQIQTKP